MRQDDEQDRGYDGAGGPEAVPEPRRMTQAPRDAYVREHGDGEHRAPRVPAGRDPWAIRAEDTEPYVGLQYVARLFKIVAMLVVVALVAEAVATIAFIPSEGTGALFTLFTEVIQGGVLAAMLWGASDLTLLFIDVGHDVRAARVLLGRLSARAGHPEHPEARRNDGEPEGHGVL